MTGLDIWASLLSTGIICTLYTTVVSGLWQLTRGAGRGGVTPGRQHHSCSLVPEVAPV